MSLPWDIQWQTKAIYRASVRFAQTDRDPRFNVNTAFSKDILDDKATLTLNVTDVFNTRKLEFTTFNDNRDDPESISDLEFQWRVRQISLNFTYRFNQHKKRDNGGAF